MKILFVLKQRNYLHTYTGVIAALAARGHAVRMAWPDDDLSLPDELAGKPITVQAWEPKRADEWASVVNAVRRSGDYLRYLEPAFRGAGKLRARAFDKLLHSLSKGARETNPAWGDVGLALTDAERSRLDEIARLMERAIPSDAKHEAFIGTGADRPDVVLVSPLIDLGSAQTDVVKSAAHLGIPTGMVLFSWDNLSTKGGLHVPPDRLFVWNERQRREAADLHGYPIEHAIATGAPRFDNFFPLRPSTERRAFLEPLRLDPSRPTLMYIGSSKFVVTSSELPFIREWVAEVRRSDVPAVRDCNIVIRPHPDVKAWEGEGEAELVRWRGVEGKGEVTRPIADPRTVVLRTHYRRAQAFFDALHHSAAVVGLNTSAALEAAIAGRPVFTILAGDDAADGQSSTLHFHYLLAEHGGCVTVARSFDEHRRQLAESLTGPDPGPRVRAFAETFLRPCGIDRPASDVLAAAIEREFAAMTGGTTAVPSAAAAAPPALPEGAGEPEARLDGDDGKGDTVTLDFTPTPILLRVSSQAERRWRAHACAKEPWTVEWLLQEVRPGEMLYDIGANVGTFALIGAKHCGASVVAFEPGAASFARLCENIHLNGCARAVVPVPLPLADTVGLTGFKYRSMEAGQSRHFLRDDAWTPGRVDPAGPGGHYIQPVCTTTLDAVIRDYRLPPPAHVKLDVDGAEVRVLRGAAAALRAPTLRTILIEAADDTWSDVERLLTAAGFRVRAQHVREHKTDAPRYAVFERGR